MEKEFVEVRIKHGTENTEPEIILEGKGYSGDKCEGIFNELKSIFGSRVISDKKHDNQDVSINTIVR